MSEAHGDDSQHPTAQRILVADDDMLIRLVVRRTLERAGYDVVDASDVESAALAARDGIELAVVDAHMPGGSLATTIAGVRGAAGEGIPILVLSGDAVLPPDVTALGVAFLTKPASVEGLLEAVRSLLAPPLTRD
jgi:two-component system KDP operon response regulator KdpE